MDDPDDADEFEEGLDGEDRLLAEELLLAEEPDEALDPLLVEELLRLDVELRELALD